MPVRGVETLEGVYVHHPGVARQIAAQERWEAARGAVLEKYYSSYTLGSLFQLIADEVLELIVDTVGNQPRELALLEAGDVHAITSKLVLHLSRTLQQPVNFEDWRLDLENIHIRASLNERLRYREEFSNKERSDLRLNAREFIQQLIVTCTVLAGKYKKATPHEALQATQWIERLLDPRIPGNGIILDEKGDPSLTPRAYRTYHIFLESTVPFLYHDPNALNLDKAAIVDLFDTLGGLDQFFPQSSPQDIGTGYYLEGPVHYFEDGLLKCINHRGKNARHIPPNKDIKEMKAERQNYPLHMLPDSAAPYGKQQAYLAKECEDPNNSEAKAAYARSELPRSVSKMPGIQVVHVNLR